MTYIYLDNKKNFSHYTKFDFALELLLKVRTEHSKRMVNIGPSNLSHVSKRPLQCIEVIACDAGHNVEVTF